MYGLSDEMFGDFKKKESYKLKNGEHKIRILPPFAPNRLFAFHRVHWFPESQGQYNIPVKCLADRKKGSEEVCPACERTSKMKADAANLIATNQYAEGKELEETAVKLSAKATYLWQVLDPEGQHKLLSISYRAHEALKEVVGFWWRQKKVNVTNPERNYKIYCNRTGQKSQTNYAWQVLDGAQDIRKIDIPELWNLDEHFDITTFEEMANIVELGHVPSRKKTDASTTTEAQAPMENPQQQQNAPVDTAPHQATPNSQTTPKEMPAQESQNNYTQSPGGMPTFTADDIPF
jgi:hypothetical protein